MLREGEGLRLVPYKCSAGHLTIGYGHKLIAGDSMAPITKAYAEDLLARDSAKAWQDAGRITGDDKSPERIVLSVMVYQLGFAGVRRHKRTITHLLSQNYDEAIQEMQYSDWFRQTPRRIVIIGRYLNAVGITR